MMVSFYKKFLGAPVGVCKMIKLQYPVFSGYSWRWSETNTTDNRDMHAVSPCRANECHGHPSPLSATLHHALVFCETAHIESREAPEKLPCQGCSRWTNARVKFANCPYDDWLPICIACGPRPHLRTQHYTRRSLLEYRHVPMAVTSVPLKLGRPPANKVADVPEIQVPRE